MRFEHTGQCRKPIASRRARIIEHGGAAAKPFLDNMRATPEFALHKARPAHIPGKTRGDSRRIAHGVISKCIAVTKAENVIHSAPFASNRPNAKDPARRLTNRTSDSQIHENGFSSNARRQGRKLHQRAIRDICASRLRLPRSRSHERPPQQPWPRRHVSERRQRTRDSSAGTWRTRARTQPGCCPICF